MDEQLVMTVSVWDMFYDITADITDIIENYIASNNTKFLLTNSIQQEHSMLPRTITCEEWLTTYSDMQFFQFFRMERATMFKLVDVLRRVDVNGILTKKYTGGHYPVNINAQVLIFLWYMSSQDSLLHIGNRFRVSPTTVMNIVNRLLYFLLKLKKIYIKFPTREQEFLDITRGFEKYPGKGINK